MRGFKFCSRCYKHTPHNEEGKCKTCGKSFLERFRENEGSELMEGYGDPPAEKKDEEEVY